MKGGGQDAVWIVLALSIRAGEIDRDQFDDAAPRLRVHELDL